MKNKYHVVILFLFLGLVGCKSEPEVRQYQAPKVQTGALSPATRLGFVWDLPPTWQELPASGMRLASFLTGQSDNAATVTLTSLPQEGFNLLANVNRWEGQLSLPHSTAEQLHKVVSKDKTKNKTLTKVTLHNDTTAFIVLIEWHDEQYYFVKLSGPIETVRQEEAHVLSFARSLTHTHETH